MRALRWLAGSGAACLLVALGPVAAAAPPITKPVPFVQTFQGTVGVCDFPITVEFNTQQTMREWVDDSGAVTRSHVTGKGWVTITNERSGASVRATASGPTLTKHGKSVGTGQWVLIGFEANADVLPFPPGAWLYSGRIADLDASSYAESFHGRVTDLCAAVA